MALSNFNRRTLRSSALSVSQKNIVTRAITGGGDLGVVLDEAQCAYLAARTALDLSLNIEGIPAELKKFFSSAASELRLENVAFLPLFEALVGQAADADTYFDCLASLHKRRLKYQKILEYQPIPTLNQVGPRGLLQYGGLSSQALVSLLFWRKWLFDLDNRAGQETGYVFEPIVARCVGGEPYGAKKSPVHRKDRPSEGRQVDCIFDNRAYEIKLRVTIAASGQGRWGEEKDFPVDCKASGYLPFLLVFDDTQADKLVELTNIFKREGGEVFVGEAAWKHLEELAGPTMSNFLELYVRGPLKNLLDNAPSRDNLPAFGVTMNTESIDIQVGDETLIIFRPASELLPPTEDEISDLGRTIEN